MKLAPIAMILTLVLGALPAAAEHRVHERYDTRLERLSHKLADATEELRQEVAESRRGWRLHKPYTLRTLDRLERDAKKFHRRVENRGVNHNATRRAFRRLEESFAAASDRISHRRFRRGIRHDFERVAKLMEKVEIRMARIDHRGDHRRHARHDRHHSDGWRVAGSFGW
jgi:hypothetical protein